MFENGKYFIGVDQLEARDELLSIGVSKHDDVVDTMAYAEQIITPHYFEVEKVREAWEQPEESNRITFAYGD
ncbi:MAG: hypothetical protein MZV64_72270 [Ignavibacteriales bacterium]|nr:hypothetical protein [Ignavibacteriales bacterium]